MAKNQTTTEKSPNESLDLSGFDYKNLTGESFTRYIDLMDSLLMNDKYDFEMWNATGVIKHRFNEDTGEKETVLVGIKLEAAKPIQRTRIMVKQANQLNHQVIKVKVPTAQDRLTSKYWLLVQPEKIPA